MREEVEMSDSFESDASDIEVRFQIDCKNVKIITKNIVLKNINVEFFILGRWCIDK